MLRTELGGKCGGDQKADLKKKFQICLFTIAKGKYYHCECINNNRFLAEECFWLPGRGK